MGASLTAHAVAPLTRSEEAVINFGFATQLGSGIYSVSGRTLQVYRLPFGYTLPAEDDARIRPRLTLPVSIGFVDFKPRDVVDSGLPEGLDTVSIVPGIALDIEVMTTGNSSRSRRPGLRDREYEIDQRYSLPAQLPTSPRDGLAALWLRGGGKVIDRTTTSRVSGSA
jgi:hypothetical protein